MPGNRWLHPASVTSKHSCVLPTERRIALVASCIRRGSDFHPQGRDHEPHFQQPNPSAVRAFSVSYVANLPVRSVAVLLFHGGYPACPLRFYPGYWLRCRTVYRCDAVLRSLFPTGCARARRGFSLCVSPAVASFICHSRYSSLNPALASAFSPPEPAICVCGFAGMVLSVSYGYISRSRYLRRYILTDHYESSLRQMPVPGISWQVLTIWGMSREGGHFKNPSLQTPFSSFCNGRLNLTN